MLTLENVWKLMSTLPCHISSSMGIFNLSFWQFITDGRVTSTGSWPCARSHIMGRSFGEVSTVSTARGQQVKRASFGRQRPLWTFLKCLVWRLRTWELVKVVALYKNVDRVWSQKSKLLYKTVVLTAHLSCEKPSAQPGSRDGSSDRLINWLL